MGILSWIILGLIAGWIAKFFMPINGGLIKTLVLGVIGAIVGGYISTFFGLGSVTGLNLFSLIIAVLGAVLVIFVFRWLTK
ncbi:GlsB/YeaQ/YmgE family stress response membrane protein [Orbus mooreae]|uniref:GlsB/YeaQ/YmgE family stress response membrane protein n=1 Tax=Orbus mooreae TaxID=3074107 RepID=UPI00370D1E2F